VGAVSRNRRSCELVEKVLYGNCEKEQEVSRAAWWNHSVVTGRGLLVKSVAGPWRGFPTSTCTKNQDVCWREQGSRRVFTHAFSFLEVRQ